MDDLAGHTTPPGGVDGKEDVHTVGVGPPPDVTGTGVVPRGSARASVGLGERELVIRLTGRFDPKAVGEVGRRQPGQVVEGPGRRGEVKAPGLLRLTRSRRVIVVVLGPVPGRRRERRRGGGPGQVVAGPGQRGTRKAARGPRREGERSEVGRRLRPGRL